MNCSRALLGKQIHVEYENLEVSKKERSVRLTHLLNQAISPLLNDIHEVVLAKNPNEILKLKEKIQNSPLGAPVFGPVNGSSAATGLQLGFDRQFDGIVSQSVPMGGGMRYAYTEFNKNAMADLFLATNLVMHIISEEFSAAIDPTLAEVPDLLTRHTYTAKNIDLMLGFGFYSILQAAAQLTAEPVGDLTATQILTRVMNQDEGRKPSPITRYSLLLAPALIAQSGTAVYMQDALQMESDGSLKLSSKFCSFLKEYRAGWSQSSISTPEIKSQNEFGHGCPVAHRVGSSERSGLQLILDSIEAIRRQL